MIQHPSIHKGEGKNLTTPGGVQNDLRGMGTMQEDLASIERSY